MVTRVCTVNWGDVGETGKQIQIQIHIQTQIQYIGGMGGNRQTNTYTQTNTNTVYLGDVGETGKQIQIHIQPVSTQYSHVFPSLPAEGRRFPNSIKRQRVTKVRVSSEISFPSHFF